MPRAEPSEGADSVSELTRATSIREAVHACELGALSGEKLAWWADLAEARGTNAVSRLKSYLDLRAPDRFSEALRERRPAAEGQPA